MPKPLLGMETTGHVIKCRAAVAWGPGEPLQIEEIEVEPPKAHEVRIKILYTSICHSDLYMMFEVKNGTDAFPCILGHEAAGVVESIGEGVTCVKPGDSVIPTGLPHCGACVLCQCPDTNLCIHFKNPSDRGVMSDGRSRFSCKGKPVYHFMGCSTFTEFTVVNDFSVAKIPEKAPLEKVCLLGCGVATGYGASLNSAGVTKGSTVGIWGLGTVGLAAVMGAAAAGAKTIVGVDINSDKFEIARKLGATETINPKELSLKQPFQLYLCGKYGGGFDYTIECTGNAAAMKEAFESVRTGGGVSCATGVATEEVSTHPWNFIIGRIWKGSCFGGWNLVAEVPKLVKKFLDGNIKLDELITHHFNLADINEGINLLRSGKSLRSVINLHAQ